MQIIWKKAWRKFDPCGKQNKGRETQDFKGAA